MSEEPQQRHLIIEGMKHCGKSTHGRALAHAFGWPFFDTDELIVEGFSRQLDKTLTIRDVFIMLGEEKFEAFEAQIVKGLYARLKNSDKRCVLALGGRPPCNPDLHPYLKSLGKVIYLRVPIPLLFRRSTRRGPVPFLDPTRAEAHFREICEAREANYMKLADVVINIDDVLIADAQKLVIDTIKTKLHDWLES